MDMAAKTAPDYCILKLWETEKTRGIEPNVRCLAAVHESQTVKMGSGKKGRASRKLRPPKIPRSLYIVAKTTQVYRV
jgi:hypothetical protein